ncbi:MAG: hypothetical protein NC083_09045 [Muribaculum sp.]|nr:hypothetical protein [Muribaculum sp.]MCM1577092.1 hypothetical protein [Bacteroides sp.]
MRHLQEKYVLPLFRILDEYEMGVRNKPKLTLTDRANLWHIGNIKNELKKVHKNGNNKSA